MIVFCEASGQGSFVAKPHGKKGVLFWVSIKTNQTASLWGVLTSFAMRTWACALKVRE